MIIDCFGIAFKSELDLLEIRLNILSPFVDYFVIVESDVTFVGNKKDETVTPLIKSDPRFKSFLNRIIFHGFSEP